MQTRLSPLMHGWFCLLSLAACNSITGLNDFSVGTGNTSQAQCMTNADCMGEGVDVLGEGGAGSGGDGMAICVKASGACVQVQSAECKTITGDVTDDRAILFGSLFSTSGATGTTNQQRQQAAQLAVQQINAVGGIPTPTGNPRKLVMVSCDEAAGVTKAAEHLVKDLRVAAIVGPNTSQDTIDVTNKVSVNGGTVVISPTAVASSITSLVDNDLTWLMVPTDVQRAPLMIQNINELETQLKDARSVSTIKLGVIYRNDALGEGTRTSINDLTLNGKPIADPINLGKNLQISPYDVKAANQADIIAKYVAFAPDIIVLAGTAEAVTAVMVPLEAQWTAPSRPYYVVIDSTKTPDLITAVTNNDDLRRRVRGTGVTPGPTSTPVNNNFKISYATAYPGMTASASGTGPAYDATFAVAFAFAATRETMPNGAAIAKGLRKLAGGATHLEVGGTTALQAFQKLAAGESIDAVGTFGPLAWDANGAIQGGTIEMWCIGGSTATPAYQSAGTTFDIATQKISGQYTPCP
ncbi:MAG: ABC transporter substrate-binding protein [Polyangiaceae bacterium]